MFEFTVQGVHAVPHTLVPMLAFELSITGAGVVQGIVLHTQIRIEPTRRSYPPEIRERLFELFGPPADWGRTVHSLLWTHADAMVPAFEGQIQIELPVPCTYDFNVAATRYFAALDTGDIPLEFLFSGTVFSQDQSGRLQVARVSWEADAAFGLPVPLWKALMEKFYPEGTWIAVHSDMVHRLDRFKRERGLLSREQAIEALLPAAPEEAAK